MLPCPAPKKDIAGEGEHQIETNVRDAIEEPNGEVANGNKGPVELGVEPTRKGAQGAERLKAINSGKASARETHKVYSS